MKYRTMPRGGERLSEIGLGLAKIHLAERREMTAVMEKAIAEDINFFDLCGHTLDVYRAFAEASAGVRDRLFTQMHVGAVYKNEIYEFSRDLDAIRYSFENVLKETKTDYTDFAMIHCIDEEEDFEDVCRNGILDYIQDLKKQGVVKHIGISTHTPVIAEKFMDEDLIDMFMFSVNPAYDYTKIKWAAGSYDQRMNLYNTAWQKGVGITVMKAFAGGQLLKEATSPINVTLTRNQCLKYALDRPAVVSCLPGVTSMAELEQLLTYHNAAEEELDYAILGQAAPSDAIGRCVYCNHCAPCPEGLDVGIINKYYDLTRFGDDLAGEHYRKLTKKADACKQCGHCEKRCPFRVKQKERMKEIAAYFKEN